MHRVREFRDTCRHGSDKTICTQVSIETVTRIRGYSDKCEPALTRASDYYSVRQENGPGGLLSLHLQLLARKHAETGYNGLGVQYARSFVKPTTKIISSSTNRNEHLLCV